MVTKPLLKNIIDVKDVKIVDFIIKKNHIEEDTLFIHIIPFKRTRGTCPYCGKKHCPGYDTPTRNKFWRHVDLCGMKTYLVSDSNRIHCPTCGVVTEKVEWAEPRAGFTKAFEDTVTWLSLHTSKKVVSAFMRCSWNSIGDCIRRAKNRVEPDPTVRYNNLVNIGVDETSHKKGYKYITTVVNLDTDEVVWISDGHGKSVFSIFFNELTEKQKFSIKTVSGDGAKRIVDPYHVVNWAQDALDEVRKKEWRVANDALKEIKQGIPRKGVGRPKKKEEND